MANTRSKYQQLSSDLKVKCFYSCTQPKEAGLGLCYGYTQVWAEDGEAGIEPDNTPLTYNQVTRLKVTQRIRRAQNQQLFNTNQYSYRIYPLARGLHNLLCDAEIKLQYRQTAIIAIHGSMYGHALGLKNLESGLEFFDCNTGKYLVNDFATFKVWFPVYMETYYKALRISYELEFVNTQPPKHEIIQSIANFLFALCNAFYHVFISMPLFYLNALTNQPYESNTASNDYQSTTRSLSRVFSKASLQDQPHQPEKKTAVTVENQAEITEKPDQRPTANVFSLGMSSTLV